MSFRSFINAMERSGFVSDDVFAGTCPICRPGKYTIFLDIHGDAIRMRHTCGCRKDELERFIEAPDDYQPPPVDPDRDQKRSRFWSLMWRLDDLTEAESVELAELHLAVEEGRI